MIIYIKPIMEIIDIHNDDSILKMSQTPELNDDPVDYYD